jgi:zinc transport system permease protein
MWTIVAIGGVIVATMAVAGRALFATVGDEEWARTVGVPVDALNIALAVLTAITIVAAMRVVGILLIAALMVLPVASGQLIARSFGRVLGWSVAIGTVSVVGGLAAARQWALAPGGTIVLGAALIFGLLALVSGSRSAVTPPFRGWRRASGNSGSPGLD